MLVKLGRQRYFTVEHVIPVRTLEIFQQGKGINGLATEVVRSFYLSVYRIDLDIGSCHVCE